MQYSNISKQASDQLLREIRSERERQVHDLIQQRKHLMESTLAKNEKKTHVKETTKVRQKGIPSSIEAAARYAREQKLLRQANLASAYS